jgi:hypothetical protein
MAKDLLQAIYYHEMRLKLLRSCPSANKSLKNKITQLENELHALKVRYMTAY